MACTHVCEIWSMGATILRGQVVEMTAHLLNPWQSEPAFVSRFHVGRGAWIKSCCSTGGLIWGNLGDCDCSYNAHGITSRFMAIPKCHVVFGRFPTRFPVRAWLVPILHVCTKEWTTIMQPTYMFVWCSNAHSWAPRRSLYNPTWCMLGLLISTSVLCRFAGALSTSR